MSFEEELKQRTTGVRFVALDALRGLAALEVVLLHFRAPFNDATPVWYLRPLFLGRPPVILFFVLSGYVLSLPVWRERQPTYGRYLVRRFFRIYVPYAAAVVLAILGARYFLNAKEPLSAFFYRSWHSPITKKLIFLQFFTMSTSPVLNTAFWTLQYEAILSVVMPFVSRSIHFFGSIKTLIVMLPLAAGLEVLIFLDPNVQLKLVGVVHFGICFVFGALLSLNREAIAAWYAKQRAGIKMAGLILAAILFYSGTDSLVMLGACGVIVFALHSRANGWLQAPVPEYLGWASYSMYLVHCTVLFPLVILLVGHLPMWGIFAIYLPSVLVVSHLFCTFIEQPALRMGRRLTSSPRVASVEQMPSTGTAV